MRYIFFLILLFGNCISVTAQVVENISFGDSISQESDTSFNRFIAEQREQDSISKIFNQQNDVLFREKKYYLLLDRCAKPEKGYLKDDAAAYQLATFYELGNIEYSDSILKTLIGYNDSSFSSVRSIFTIGMGAQNKAMEHFLEVVDNRIKIEKFIWEHYNKVNTFPNKKAAKKILHLILNDQYIRGKYRAKGQAGLKEFEQLNQANLGDQFTYFNELGHIHNAKEIGPIYGEQFLLLAHEANLERREFYLGLIKKAVTKGDCKVNRIPDFILRTEMMEKGQKLFLKDLFKREQELREEFGIPSYHFSIR